MSNNCLNIATKKWQVPRFYDTYVNTFSFLNVFFENLALEYGIIRPWK